MDFSFKIVELNNNEIKLSVSKYTGSIILRKEMCLWIINTLRNATLDDYYTEGKEWVERALRLTDLTGLRRSGMLSLSGGETQKTAVARMFAKDFDVAILDEPSSALDPIAEYKLFDNILKACKKNTLLFISHRLSSVQNADHVFLLEKGEVKEEGTHRELMAKNGLYADMYNKQAENYLADKTKQTEGIWA